MYRAHGITAHAWRTGGPVADLMLGTLLGVDDVPRVPNPVRVIREQGRRPGEREEGLPALPPARQLLAEEKDV